MIEQLIGSLIDHARKVRFSEAGLELFCAYADTREDIGLRGFAKTSWHNAADQYATSVSFEINTPNGFDARVVGTDTKTGRAVVHPTALKRWWPEIQKAIRRFGEPNFGRLHELLVEEYARVIERNPSRKKTLLESSHNELILCLRDIQSLFAQMPMTSTEDQEANG